MSTFIIRLMSVIAYIAFFAIWIGTSGAGYWFARQELYGELFVAAVVGSVVGGLVLSVLTVGVIVVLIDIRDQLVRLNQAGRS